MLFPLIFFHALSLYVLSLQFLKGSVHRWINFSTLLSLILCPFQKSLVSAAASQTLTDDVIAHLSQNVDQPKSMHKVLDTDCCFFVCRFSPQQKQNVISLIIVGSFHFQHVQLLFILHSISQLHIHNHKWQIELILSGLI